MKINTKYSIGEEVWTEWNGKPAKVKIVGVKVNNYYGEETISYIVDYDPDEILEDEIEEDDLFPTLNALIASGELMY